MEVSPAVKGPPDRVGSQALVKRGLPVEAQAEEKTKRSSRVATLAAPDKEAVDQPPWLMRELRDNKALRTEGPESRSRQEPGQARPRKEHQEPGRRRKERRG